MEKVSVIIPNYNGAKYIEDAILSVINQTYKIWELIIIDDGSTDDSEMKINKYLSDKILFIKRPKTRVKGGNTCRNIGIENASGKYIIFLDSDDLLAEYCLEQRVKWMNNHDNVDFAVFNMYRFYDDVSKKQLHTKLNVVNPLSSFLGLNCLWQTTAPIWRMDFVKQVKFNEKYSRLQDPEMVIRSLMQDGVSYYLVNDSKPDAFYRLSSGSPTKKNIERNVSSNYNKPFAQFINDFCSIMNSSNSFEKSKDSIFLQLSLHHLLISDFNDISVYKKSVLDLNKKMSISDQLIYLISTHILLIRLMRNRFARRCCTLYFKHKLKHLWGDLYIGY